MQVYLAVLYCADLQRFLGTLLIKNIPADVRAWGIISALSSKKKQNTY